MTTLREVVPRALAGERVDRVVAMLTGLPRSEVADLVAAGGVRVDDRTVTERARRLAEGEHLEVDVPERVEVELAPDPSVDVPVVFGDESVVVVDKPAGLVVHPGAGRDAGSMVAGLLARFPDLAGVGGDPLRPGVVHRLDAGTSGLLVVARTERAHESLVEQLSSRSVEREYAALVWGHLDAPNGVVDAPVGRAAADPTRMAVSARGRPARTRYEVRRQFALPVECSLLSCRLESGRTHQIRVHLSAIGHAVVGDARYGGAKPALALPRPFLHAARLAFDHPATGERMEWSSPLPADLSELLSTLREG